MGSENARRNRSALGASTRSHEGILLKQKKTPAGDGGKPERQPYRVRLPGFITDEEIGLGDAIKRVTYAVGIKPCGACEKRAAALNRWMVFF